ncbi:MAG TPA: TetR/AcrR family transcriptional regulator [bacterium]|nr:TetR/AcrR family transcriptional regulator [bacterium]
MTKKEASTKEKILLAAEDEFAEQGFAGARTQEIARKAQVNKALIHYYYKDKSSLYQAVMDEMMYDLIRISQDVAKRKLTGKALVEALVSDFFDFAARHPHFAKLTTAGSTMGDAKYLETSIKNLFRPLFQRGVEFLEEHMEKGAIRKVDAPQFLVSALLLTLSYFAMQPMISLLLGKDAASKTALEQRKKSVLDFVFATLGVQ